MSIIAWNWHGLGNPQTVRNLLDLIKKEGVVAIFLSEIKSNQQEMERVRCKVGFNNCFTVNSSGRRGGLAILWQSEIVIDLVSYSMNHIDTRVLDNRRN